MKIKSFAILSGSSAKIEGEKIVYARKKKTNKVKEDPEDKDDGKDPVKIRTNQHFSNGSIKFKFKTNSAKAGILVVLNATSNNLALIGHSYDFNEFVAIEVGSENGSKAGSLKNYDLSNEHSLQITVQGSITNLYVDDVLITTSNIEIKDGPISFKLCSDGIIELYDFDISVQSKKAFIVMQFTKEYDELYAEVIKPVCKEFNIETVRADEYYSSTPIITDIIESIKESSLIIADITPDNPNVFYEIGYAHAIQKSVILLSDKKREKLPFDLSSFRTIFYENSISGKKKVEDALRKYLKALK